MHLLTAPQKNIWNLQKFYSESSISVISGMLTFQGILNTEYFRKAINLFIKNQAGTRLRFTEKGGEVYQYVSEYEYVDIPVLSFESMDKAEEFFRQESVKPFRFLDSPMYRFFIFAAGKQCGIYPCFSHLISDAWTLSLFCQDIMKYYNLLEKGMAIIEKPISYINYIKSEEEYLQSPRYAKDKEYWSDRFTNKPELKKIKPLSSQSKTIQAERITRTIERHMTEKIKFWCSLNHISIAIMFEAAVIAYLYRINEKSSDEIIIGIPVLNRTTRQEKETAGMFISTMPLGVSVEDKDTVSLLCEKIAESHREVFRHQKFPYLKILKTVREKYDYSGNLYDVMVSYQNASIKSDNDVEYATQWFSNGYSEIPLALHIDDREQSGNLTINLNYQTEVFSDREVELLYERFLHIINQFMEDGSQTVGEISIIPNAEFDLMIYDFNDTAVDYPRDKCVHELFAEQVAKTPDKIALVFEDEKFTYRQLDEMSNSLGHYLRDKGVKPNDVVPIIAKRSWHVIVAMLGVLKAGGAYMPVDPNYPIDRITHMIEIAKSKIALLYGIDKKWQIESIGLIDFDFAYNESALRNINQSEDSVYVIFTSGSTSVPKGITICHRNVCNYSNNNNNNNVCHKIVKNECERIVSVTNIIFDIFVTESLLSLLNGLCIYFANDSEVFSQQRLGELVEKNDIDVIQTTPTKMKSYILDKNNTDYLRGVKAIILGGEALSIELYHELKSCTDAKIYNIYGPAETTVWSTNAEVMDNDITIGKPIANTQIYICDKDNYSLPIGVAGELCIAGDGVGKGYLNRPELTAERFVPNPFSTKDNGHGEVLYHTGDLARWRTDGEIEYLGRIDSQVKIRGLRIELGEIENVMSSFNGLNLTAVTDKRDGNGRQYLVGYYTSDSSIDEKQLRSFLATKLPKYMIPNYFLKLESMPMTASGKTDRKNLPLPVFSDIAKEYTAPETAAEKVLTEIWSDILGYDNIGKNSDFMECGGDSLGAIRMLAAIEERFHRQVELRDIMQYTILSNLAEWIERAPIKAESIPVTGAKEYVLTPQQKAIYFSCMKGVPSLSYNMPVFIPLNQDTDINKLKERITRCYNNHPILKSAITMKGSEIIGIIQEDAILKFEVLENKKDFVRPFDFAKAPLMRVGFGCGGMAMDIHHIVGDGESLHMLMEEIFDYADITEKVGYADYALYFYDQLNNGKLDAHKEYYKKLLSADIEPIQLPLTNHPESAGAAYTHLLSRETADKMRQLSKKYAVTKTCMFFSIYGILLSNFINRKYFVSSIVLSNRTHAETRNTFGMFVNTIPVVFDASANQRFDEYVSQISEALFNAHQYQELPLLEICEAAGIRDKNVINTTFVYQPGEEASGKRECEYLQTNTYKMDIAFQVIPQTDDNYKIVVEYNKEKYDTTLVLRLVEGYERIIRQIADNEKISDVTVMSSREFQQVIYDFNDTAVDYPRDKCVQELFEEQAAKTPDQTALIFEKEQFTYRRVDEMSNALANFLREQGVKPNEIVAVIAGRSWHMIVAILGILKSGGAYMPIDPNYPEDRIRYMIEEADSNIALTLGYNKKMRIKTVELESFDYSNNISSINVINSPEDICYVIFTSGSTGKPKGVLLRHSGLVNFIYHSNVFHKAVFQNCRRILAIGAFTFDISVSELFPLLVHGGSIVIANDSVINSPELMAAAITEYSVDLLHATPTRLSYYLDNEHFRKAMSGVKVLLSAGEAFSADLYDKIRSCADAEIYNGYGPTETTVGCSFVRVEKPNEITIGKPISNVQLYILDQNAKPCPIGVAGELCISGDGVGKGYLNRPELTAEKFVPNPFIKGKTMYRTGDLARWRADGEIEYLGRIDSQVKIRGLRIELGEIESVMSSFDGIRMAAVADKRDESCRQYLVGYYTSDGEVDETALRIHLSAKLPKYMVPNYFMRLTEIPVTTSGKTDRKNLPVPQHKVLTDNFVSPRNDMEKTLCDLVAEILGYEKVGINDDFFELGGDSLKALEYTARAAEKGITFKLQAIFEYPTIAALSRFMMDRSRVAPQYFKSDFERLHAVLSKNSENSSFTPKYQSLGNVLLTGATGYLGAHILDSFIRNEEGKIYCLVRGDSYEKSKKRLSDTLHYYFDAIYDDEMEKRIIPIVGNILSEELWKTLPCDVETVIHSAATVKHYGDYSGFYSVNVKGTENILQYANKQDAKFLFISTVSVGGMNLVESGNGTALFRESDLFINQELSNVYIRSKFEAERLVLKAMLSGAKCTVFRVGNLTNRYSDGKFQPNHSENAFLRRIKAFIDAGAYPLALADKLVEFSPVDDTAEAIIRLAEYVDNNYSVFHVNNPYAITYSHFSELLKKSGCIIEAIDSDYFVNKIHSSDSPVYGTVINELNEVKEQSGYVRVTVDNSFTKNVLKAIEFQWKVVTEEYLEKYVRYFEQLNYWTTHKNTEGSDEK